MCDGGLRRGQRRPANLGGDVDGRHEQVRAAIVVVGVHVGGGSRALVQPVEVRVRRAAGGHRDLWPGGFGRYRTVSDAHRHLVDGGHLVVDAGERGLLLVVHFGFRAAARCLLRRRPGDHRSVGGRPRRCCAGRRWYWPARYGGRL